MSLNLREFSVGKKIFRPDIQGLRGLAVLFVVLYHADLPLSGGFIGVDVFFVISGFVILGVLSKESTVSKNARLANFYRSRFWRLAPALSVTTFATVLLSAFIISPFGPQVDSSKTALGAVFGLANATVALTTGGYFDRAADTNTLLHTWSLSVESQFYLFISIAFWAIVWSKKDQVLAVHRLKIFLLSIFLTSFFCSIALEIGFIPKTGIALLDYLSPLTRAWEFAIGALTYLFQERFNRVSSHLSRILLGLGVLALISSAFFINEALPFPGPWALWPVFATATILAFNRESTKNRIKLLSNKYLVALGDASYSIYLWHWPIIVFLKYVQPNNSLNSVYLIILTLAISFLSYKYVEIPFRGNFWQQNSSKSTTGFIFLAVPVTISIAVILANNHFYWNRQIESLQAQISEEHYGAVFGCNSRVPLGRLPEKCKLENGEDQTKVYLLGDSNADQFSEGLIAASSNLGLSIQIATTSNCPFTKTMVKDKLHYGLDESCAFFNAESLRYLIAASPATVIIANSDKYPFSPEFELGISNSSPNLSKLSKWKKGLSDVVLELRRAGHKVIVFQAIPKWNGEGFTAVWDPSLCSAFAAATGTCVKVQSLSSFLQQNRTIRAAISEASKASGATVWDPARHICQQSQCRTQTGEYLNYRDSGHISVSQSDRLKNHFIELLKKTFQE